MLFLHSFDVRIIKSKCFPCFTLHTFLIQQYYSFVVLVALLVKYEGMLSPNNEFASVNQVS